MIYGYARCSTNENKQDINRQINEMKAFNVDKSNIFFEYESGTKTNRLQLNKLFATIEKGDTLVVTEISRLSRSTKQLCEIIEIVKELKVKLIVGTLIIDCTKELDVMTEGMLKMMSVFSELEKNMISNRVKSGLKNAKTKGKKLGRPTTTTKDIPDSIKQGYKLYKSNQIKKIEFARMCNVSRPTIDKYIKVLETQN